MMRSAETKGARSCVAIINARAVKTAVTLATQRTGARLRFQARADAPATNAVSTPAVTEAGNTLKRSVSSQSMGARIKPEVTAYAALAKGMFAGTRAAHSNHIPA
jgi:hypothetical protein